MRKRKEKLRDVKSAQLPPYQDKEMTNVAALRYPEDGEPEEIGGRLQS